MKENLSVIMREFAAVEYGMNAMVSLLATLEEYYDLEHRNELKRNVNVMKRLLDSLVGELGKTIAKLDTYMEQVKRTKQLQDYLIAASLIFIFCIFGDIT